MLFRGSGGVLVWIEGLHWGRGRKLGTGLMGRDGRGGNCLC